MINHTTKTCRISLAIAIFACVAGSTICVAHSQTNDKAEISINPEERAVAARVSSYSSSNKLDNVKEKHLDGVKGSNFIINVPIPPINGPIANRQVDTLRFYACNAAVFGEYKLVAQRSFASDGGNLIFTKRRFKLVDDWSVRDEKTLGQVDVVMQGGEVTWKGERIRVENALQKYKVGRNYIVAVGQRTPEQEKVIFGEMLFLEVDNGVIYPGEEWKLFEKGTEVKAIKSKLSEAISVMGCRP